MAKSEAATVDEYLERLPVEMIAQIPPDEMIRIYEQSRARA
jgi:hypothetical protein